MIDVAIAGPGGGTTGRHAILPVDGEGGSAGIVVGPVFRGRRWTNWSRWKRCGSGPVAEGDQVG